jgi:hypothetical protein
VQILMQEFERKEKLHTLLMRFKIGMLHQDDPARPALIIQKAWRRYLLNFIDGASPARPPRGLKDSLLANPALDSAARQPTHAAVPCGLAPLCRPLPSAQLRSRAPHACAGDFYEVSGEAEAVSKAQSAGVMERLEQLTAYDIFMAKTPARRRYSASKLDDVGDASAASTLPSPSAAAADGGVHQVLSRAGGIVTAGARCAGSLAASSFRREGPRREPSPRAPSDASVPPSSRAAARAQPVSSPRKPPAIPRLGLLSPRATSPRGCITPSAASRPGDARAMAEAVIAETGKKLHQLFKEMRQEIRDEMTRTEGSTSFRGKEASSGRGASTGPDSPKLRKRRSSIDGTEGQQLRRKSSLPSD